MSRRLVELTNGSLLYTDLGSGPPLVFVHGFGCNHHLWISLLEPLAAQGWRCLAPDWPMGAHRLPMRPDADLSIDGLADYVEEFLAALGLERVTLIGNDAGGAVSQVIAARGNQRVGRLVLTPCDAFDNLPPAPIRPLAWAARMPAAPWLLAQLLRLRIVQRLPCTYGWTTRDGIDDETMNVFLEPLRHDAQIRRDAAKLLRSVNAHATQRAAQRLPAFNGPALVVWGTDDRLFPLDHADRLAVLMPNAELTLVEHARAFLSLDAPEQLLHRLRDFLGRTDDQLAHPPATA